MDKLLSKLRSEPVRVRLYSLAVLCAAYLVTRGYIQPTDAEFIGGIALLVLGVEASRAKVSPTK